jgi:GTP-binding protein
VERCRVLVHLVDLGAEGEGREPLHDWEVINRELQRHSAELAEKPQLVVASKMDLTHARERLPAFEKAMKKRGVPVLPISSATGEGVQALLDRAARVLYGRPEAAEEVAPKPRPAPVPVRKKKPAVKKKKRVK